MTTIRREMASQASFEVTLETIPEEDETELGQREVPWPTWAPQVVTREKLM